MLLSIYLTRHKRKLFYFFSIWSILADQHCSCTEASTYDYVEEEDAGLYKSLSNCRLWIFASSTRAWNIEGGIQHELHSKTNHTWAVYLHPSLHLIRTNTKQWLCNDYYTFLDILINKDQSVCLREILQTFDAASSLLDEYQRTKLEQEMGILSQELHLWCGLYSV